MNLQQAAYVLGFEEIPYLMKQPIQVVRTRYENALAMEYFTRAAALQAVIQRMEIPPMTNNPNAPKLPPKREAKVIDLTYETSQAMNFIESMLENILTGQPINHDEQTIWDLAFDIAVARAEQERAGE